MSAKVYLMPRPTKTPSEIEEAEQARRERDAWADGVKDRITSAQKSAGLTQRTLGKRVGVTGSAIAQRIGREGSLREWWTLYRLCATLNVSADVLLGLKTPTGPAGVDRRLIESALRKSRAASEAGDAAAAALLEALGKS